MNTIKLHILIAISIIMSNFIFKCEESETISMESMTMKNVQIINNWIDDIQKPTESSIIQN